MARPPPRAFLPPDARKERKDPYCSCSAKDATVDPMAEDNATVGSYSTSSCSYGCRSLRSAAVPRPGGRRRMGSGSEAGFAPGSASGSASDGDARDKARRQWEVSCQ